MLLGTVLAVGLPIGVARASCALSVSTISPDAGFTPGGVTTTITGCGFTGAGTLSVSFGAAAAATVVVVDDSTATAVSPAHTAGAVAVSVKLGATTGTGAPTFTYVATPTLTSLAPASGPEAGGTTLRLVGTGLSPTQATATMVSVGATAATGVAIASTTKATAVSPAGTGTPDVTIVVTLPGAGNTATSNGLPFTYVPAPVVTSVAPSTGPPTGGQDVIITGSHFQPGASVFFGASATPVGGTFTGDSAANPVSVLSSTSILVTTRAGSPGATNVVVLNPDGQYGALTSANANHYTFGPGIPPVITTVTPSSGGSLGGTTVAIVGTGFVNGASVTFGAVGQLSPPKGTGLSVNASGTSLSVTTPAHAAGTVNVVVTNPVDAQTSTSVGSFTYVAAATPTLTSLAPATGSSLGGVSVSVTGSHFSAGARVTFGSTASTTTAVLSATTLTAIAPAHAAGTVDVVVTNADGQATAPAQFTYTSAAAPTISSITPDSGSGGATLTISGTGFANINSSSTNAVSAAVVSIGSPACDPSSPSTALSTCLKPLPPVPRLRSAFSRKKR